MAFTVSPSDVISAVAACAKAGEAFLSEALGLQEHPMEYNPTFQTPNVLCEQCRSIFSETRVFRLRHIRSDETANVLLLHPMAADNCKLCNILLHRLSDSLESPVAESEPLEVKFWLVNDPMFLYGSYNVRFEVQNSEGVTMKKFKLLVVALESDEENHNKDRMAMPQWEPLSDKTSSAKSLKFFDGWLQTCKQSHDTCHKAQTHEGKYVPKRLIQIQRSGKEYRLRLIETRKLKSKVRYMTLSHCWGVVEITRLRLSKFNDFLNDIPVKSLPQLFVDAVSIAVRAGVNYIWIDSLCIIQDSPEDWARESAKMGRIYLHGYCNIAGTGFSDGSQGLFASRTPSMLEPLEYDIDCDIKLQTTTAIKQGPHLLLDYNMWKRGVAQAPLNGRGWVLQERVLSPRTIHFGSDQLFWECLQYSACEVFPSGYPKRMRTYGVKSAPNVFNPPSEKVAQDIAEVEEELEELKQRAQEVVDEEVWSDDSFSETMKSLHQRKLILLHGRKVDLTKRLFRLQNPWKTFNRGWCGGNSRWNRLMKMYSTCKLTVPTDKLMAISGLAQDHQNDMDGDYLAGLWRTALEHQLIWKVVKVQLTPVPQTLRGPSWSWAYVDGKTEFAHAPDQDGGTIYPTIINADVVLANRHEKFGPVQSGVLRLSGVLGVLRLSTTEVDSVSTDELGREQDHHVSLNWDTQELRDHFTVSFLKTPQIYVSFQEDAWEGENERGNEAVFFMPIRSMGIDPDFDIAITLSGLLLVPTMQVRGQYRRVGLFESRESRARVSEDGRVDWGVLTKNIGELDVQYYEELKEDGSYTITII